MVRYAICEETYRTEEGMAYVGYGIKMLDENGDVVDAFEDLFFEREKAERLVDELIANNIERDYIRAAVCAAVEREYDVTLIRQ